MTPKDLTRRFFSLLDAQRWDEVAALVAPDAAVRVGSAPAVPFHQAQNLRALYAAFPDGTHVLEEFLLAEGDRVVTRGRFEGTHKGPFRGIPASGERVSFAVVHIDRFEGEKLVEHIGQPDILSLMRQIKALP
jgi:predicted ester cyclase